MPHDQTSFSNFQIFTLCAVSSGLGTFCFAPFYSSGAGAAWPYAVLLAILLSSVMTAFYMRYNRNGGNSFEAILDNLLHPFVSQIILFVAGLFFIFQSALTAFITADGVGMYLLEKTPRGAILIALIFTACTVHDAGLKFTSRCCELLLMFTALPLAILLAVCLLNIDLCEASVIIQPDVSEILELLPSAVLSCSGTAAVVFAAGHRANNASGAALGYFISAAISITLFICSAGIFTAEGVASQKFPFIEMARSVRLGSISLTERFDAIFISVMIIAAVMQMALFGGCASHCLSSVFRLRSQKCFTWLLLPAVFLISYYAEYRTFLNFTMQVVLRGTTAILFVVIPIICIAGKFMKKGADIHA